CSVTRKPRASSKDPIDAAASPLPSEDTTPPVTKMNLVVTSRLLSRCEPFFHEFPLLGQRARPAEREQVAAGQPRPHRAPVGQVPLDPPARPRPAPEPGRERGRLRRPIE